MIDVHEGKADQENSDTADSVEKIHDQTRSNGSSIKDMQLRI